MTRWLAIALLVGGCGGGGGSGVKPDGPPSTFAPQLSVDPQSATIGASPIGTRLGGAHITVTNIGGAATGTITPQLTGGDFSIISTGCTTLDVLATCDVELGVTPSVVGAITGSFTVTAAPGGLATATLAATGQPRNDLTAPDRVDFGGVPVGHTSATLTATITNTGPVATGPLTAALQTGTVYAIAVDGCTGTTVAPAGTCTVTLTYTPAALTPFGGGGDLDALIVRGDPGGVSAATLAGFGLALEATPQMSPFPATAVGQTSAPRTFTVTNRSAAAIGPLTTSLVVAGAYVVGTNTCQGATLAAGGTCTVDVSFAPVAAGAALSGVQVNDASVVNYTTIQLIGTAP